MRTSRSSLLPACALTGALATLSCGGGVGLPIAQGDLTKPEPPRIPSFATDIAPVLNNTCALSGCHSPQFPPRGLILTSDQSYALLVNVASREVPELLRVAPSDPDNSYLVQKLEGTAAVGERMPRNGPPMPDAFLATVRDWIAAGAPNN